MADATSTVTVDGVEPSILVRLLDVLHNPHSIKIFNDDSGGERHLHKGGDSLLVTPKDMSVLGPFAVEVVDKDETTFAPSVPQTPAPEPPIVAVTIPDKTPISPGQSGQ